MSEKTSKKDKTTQADAGKNSKVRSARCDSSARGGSHNDPEWYAVNNQLLADVASLAFPEVAGIGRSASWEVTGGGEAEGLISYAGSVTYRFPGVMSLEYMPAIGESTSKASPVNVAAQAIYTFIRHANSGHSNYEPADYMMYLLACDSILTYLEEMKRVYGLLTNYPIKNRYCPDALIYACGCDPIDLRANMADFRAYINTFALRAGSLAIPGGMSYFKRHAWMAANVFKDAETEKAQLYLFKRRVYLKFTATSPTGTSLEADHPWYSADSSDGLAKNLAALKSIGDSLLDAMLTNEDVGIMSGDTLKAFGDAGLEKFTGIDESYATPITYQPEVLVQIHNARAFYSNDANNQSVDRAARVYQQNGAILADASIEIEGESVGAFAPIDQLLDVPAESPTPGLVAVATRCMPSVTTHYTGTGWKYSFDAASDWIWRFCVYNMETAEVEAVSYGNVRSGLGRAFHDVSTFFNYPPLVQATDFQLGNDAVTVYTAGELNNYTFITNEQLRKMNFVIAQSLFAVPSIGYVRERI